MQSSLPAGWLAFTGRESNPLDHNKRFQITHPPFLDLSWRYRDSISVGVASLAVPVPYQSTGPASCGAFSCVPSMIDSLEVEVLYPA
jgi:hypothetical protein